MANPIVELFKNIKHDELKQAIKEIQEDVNGTICDGVVRKYARKINEITNEKSTLDLHISEINLLRQAAYRWYNIVTIMETELGEFDHRCEHCNKIHHKSAYAIAQNAMRVELVFTCDNCGHKQTVK